MPDPSPIIKSLHDERHKCPYCSTGVAVATFYNKCPKCSTVDVHYHEGIQSWVSDQAPLILS